MTHNDKIDNEVNQADQDSDKYPSIKEQTNTSGRLVVYGDSNCIDDSHLQKCMYYKTEMLKYFKCR